MRWRRLVSWILLPLAVVAGLWQVWPQPRAAAYRIYREQGRERTLSDLAGYEQATSTHFILYYTAEDRDVTDLVLQTAENLYGSVVAKMGFSAPGSVPLILYPNRDELRAAFGWGSDQSALGVYWQGTIRLLSPKAWITGTGAKQQKVFQKLNPIAHELTHYLLDFMTSGNYPHWYTEGLAQRVEHQATGFLWIESSSSLRQSLYTMSDLRDRFDQLANQPLAYRQSYLLVQYMAELGGEESLATLNRNLANGQSFERAVLEIYGQSTDDLYTHWQSWVAARIDQLEQES